MMRRAVTVLILLSCTVFAVGQSLQDYLKLRKEAGISEAAGIPALEAFIGKRTLELRGTVKGSFSANGRNVLLVDRGDGDSIYVQAATIPDWLTGSNVTARLLIRAERDDEFSDIRAWLIAAASDAEITSREEAERKRLEAAAKRANLAKRLPTKPAKVPAMDWNLPASQVTPVYASFIKSRNKRLNDSEAMRIAQSIVGFSIRDGVDARLIMAMVMVESGFNPSATSRVGAMGLGQLMPGTARSFGLTNAYDSVQNLYATVRTIRGHLERYGKKSEEAFEALILSLAAYNAGSGNVRRHGGVPPFRETQNYIRKVISLYQAFAGQKG